MAELTNDLRWSEQDSQSFIDLGRYYVPQRELQLEMIVSLVPPRQEPYAILELACGEGLLAQALLERHPKAIIHGLDGSPTMLEQARQRLASYGSRFMPVRFELAAPDWRTPAGPIHAVVSSLAIHHLSDAQKRVLYQDLYALLADEGVLVIADLVQPAHALGLELAARAWDQAVRERALALDGTLQAFEQFRNDQWNIFWHPDPMDLPSRLADQLRWLEQAGFLDVDVYWLRAGHAIFGGRKGSC